MNLPQGSAEAFSKWLLVDQQGNGSVPLADLAHLAGGHGQTAAQQAGASGGERFVDHAEQRSGAAALD